MNSTHSELTPNLGPICRRFLFLLLITSGVVALRAQTTTEDFKLLASDGAAGDIFGWSVSVSGDVAVIGAFGDDESAPQTGSAYVYRHDGVAWNQEAKLLAGDGAIYDSFGMSVAVSGDVAVIGAWLDDDIGSNSGSAYIFRYDGTTWNLETKLLASDGAVGDTFGISVAVSGDVVVIGAWYDDDSGSESGSAYVFRHDGITWNQEAKLLAGDGAASDHFGNSVAISGNIAVISAGGDDDNGSESGSAYVFRYDGITWNQEAKLLAGDGTASDYFGSSVAVSGQVAVIGAWGDDDSGSESGSAYVYRHDGVAWSQEAKLLASDGVADDGFGGSVAISGEVAVIGADRDDDNGSRSGSAYVYRHDGTAWNQEAKLLASDGSAGDIFGLSVSVSRGVAVVGAPVDDESGSLSGSAYIFSGLSPSSGATPVGENVVVAPVTVDASGEPVEDAPVVALIFDEVTSAGTTTVTLTETGPPPMSGFRLGDPEIYLEIETSAFYTGPILLCIDYSTLTFTGSPENIKLGHYDPLLVDWEDITVQPVDTVNQVICGLTDSLSPFAIVELADPIELLWELFDTVANINANKGIANSLDKKLQHVEAALTDASERNDLSAINVLMHAFVQSVNAQRGEQLLESEADVLLAKAEEIIWVLTGDGTF